MTALDRLAVAIFFHAGNGIEEGSVKQTIDWGDFVMPRERHSLALALTNRHWAGGLYAVPGDVGTLW